MPEDLVYCVETIGSDVTVHSIETKRHGNYVYRVVYLCLLSVSVYKIAWEYKAPSSAQVSITWCIASILVGCLLILTERRQVVKETLTLLRNIGLQLESTRRDGSSSCKFIDVGRIRSIVINEAITRCRVVFYLAILTDQEYALIPAFQNTTPRLSILQQIYTSANAILMLEGNVSSNFSNSKITSFTTGVPTEAGGRKKLDCEVLSSGDMSTAVSLTEVTGGHSSTHIEPVPFIQPGQAMTSRRRKKALQKSRPLSASSCAT